MATLPAMLASPRGIPRLCGLLGLSLRVNRAPTRGIVGCAVTIAVGIAEFSDTANKEGHRVEKGSASASGSVMQLALIVHGVGVCGGARPRKSLSDVG